MSEHEECRHCSHCEECRLNCMKKWGLANDIILTIKIEDKND